MPCRPRRNSVAHQGFTLIEILVVLVILGIAAAMVVPRITGMGDMQASGAARILLADMQYAQNEAIVTQKDVTVTFNTGNGSYVLSNTDGTLTHPLNKTPFVTALPSMAGYRNIQMLSANFGGTNRVTFDSMGSPDNGGQVVLSADGNGYRLTLAPVTGKVSVESLSD